MSECSETIKEIWRDIPGKDGLYQVSNTGKVRSVDRVIIIKQRNRVFKQHLKGRPIKPQKDRYGYLYVNLNGKAEKVHRLVAYAFLGKSNMTVNHIDEDKTNNHISNLEYMSISDNLKYGTGMDRRRLAASKRGKAVEQLDKLTGCVIKKWASISETAKGGFIPQHIGKVCLGQRHSSGGFGWRYVS